MYGTLRRGGVLHRHMGSCPYLGCGRTDPAYRLVRLGWYPGMLTGGTTAVFGELYEVDELTLAALDDIEEHPRVFVRSPIVLPSLGVAQVYLLRTELAGDAPEVPGGVWPIAGGR